MNNFDLRQLRYFVAVAEELHFGRAALRLHISQPPLSQNIAALEIALGIKLFNRTKHKVEITNAGAQLLKDARAILNQAQKAEIRAKAADQGQEGTLHIGLNYTAPLSPALSSALYRFSSAYPKVSLEFHENIGAKQIEDLQAKALDLCFIWPTKDDLRFPVQLHYLTSDPVCLAMRRDHPLAHQSSLTIRDLEKYPLFLTARQTRTDFFDGLTTAFDKAKINPDIRTDIIQLPFILNFIVTGHGLAFLPQFLERIRPKDVIFRECNFLPKRQRLMPLALAHRVNDASPLVQNFVKSLEK